MTPRFLTTSWDDGHPLDLRVAEMLARHGCKGTFYVPSPSCGMRIMSPSEIRSLRSSGMELGAHTVSHAVLTGLDSGRIRRELVDGKRWLEDILGAPVSSFCFPKGKFSRRVSRLVQESGYRLARTTVAFHTGLEFDPFAMPVSFQFVPHSRQIHLRHGLREGNLAGMLNWAARCGLERDLERLTGLMMARVSADGGVVHIWGHSWELEQHDLWPVLDRSLKLLAEFHGWESANNAEVTGAR